MHKEANHLYHAFDNIVFLPSTSLIKLENLSDEEIVTRIGTALKGKKAALGGHKSMEDLALNANRPMILIGG